MTLKNMKSHMESQKSGSVNMKTTIHPKDSGFTLIQRIH